MNTFLKIIFPAILGTAILFQSAVNSGTVDSTSLSPASVLLERPDLNTRATIRFEATNDTTGTLRTYHAEFSYSPGLDIVMATQPAAKTATVDTRKKRIVLEWISVGPGTVLAAYFSVASQTLGIYSISPVSVYYLDSNRIKHVASCNGATITVQKDTTAPEAPTHVRSEVREGSIQVSWWGIYVPDIGGYNIYRRSPTTGFTKLNVAPLSNVVYQDTTVQNGDTYYYAATTIDFSGNESTLSEETGETYYDLKIRNIPATGIMAAAVGDINGDGKADIVLSRYYSEVTRKTTTTGHKIEIYYGGSTSGLPDVTIKGEKLADNFGTSLAVVDMNNDGYDDVIVGAPTYSPPNYSVFEFEQGKIYIYAGGLEISTSPAYTKTGNASQGCYGTQQCWYAEHLGASVASAGDLDGDGYQDIVIGAPMGALNAAGRIVILHGSYLFGLFREEEFQCTTRWQQMGTVVAAAGDVNGDGYRDVLAAGPANRLYNAYGKAFLFSGGPSLSQLFEYSTGVDYDGFGTLVASMGDINGDGYTDIAVTSWIGAVHYAEDAQIRPFFGGQQLENTPGRYLYQSTGHILPLGNVNHDGYDDFATDGPTVYFGNTVNDNVADIVRTGASLLAVGDVDGDGVKDLVTQTTATITVMSIAPYLTLPNIIFTSPHDRAKTGNPDITVQGIVKGAVTRMLVNGQVVPVQTDGAFSANVSLMLGNNTFEVIAETPDGKISKRKMTVTYVIPDPLALAITSPADNTVVDVDSIMVSGTVSDSQASVRVNGVQAIVSHGSFTATGVALAEGTNTITAAAQDDYGQTASKSVVVILTSRGTVNGTVTDVSGSSPLPGAVITITDAISAKSTISAVDGSYSMTGVKRGNFTATFEKTGYVTRTESRTLIAGQTLMLNASLQLTPPLTLSITSPVDGATVHASALQVGGLVSNNVQVTVNGIAATVSNGAFQATVPIHEGGNSITAAASDQYGQTASRGISVTLAGLLDKQEIFIAPTVLAFPSLMETTSWVQYLTVSNIGTENLAIGGINGQYLPFRIVSNDCAGVTLAPSESCGIAVKFSPPTAGTFTRTLSIPSNDMDHPYYSVTLTGTATGYTGGYVVPDTGQRTCAGEYPRNPLSYEIQLGGIVSDNNTGILWQQADDGQPRSWTDAGSYCSSLNLGGLSGWRLPTRNELLSIIDYGKYLPAIDPGAFLGTTAAAYWSATEDSAGAWAVDFGSGSASLMTKTTAAMVRCVLGPSPGDVPLWDNGDRTVTDLENGLMWVQQQITNPATQEGASNLCASTPIAGYTDWRVPTIKELATNRFNNCFMGDCRMWSSTVSDHSVCSQGYLLDLTSIVAENKANYHFLTCVRGGRTKQALTAPVISGPTITTDAGSAVVSWTTDQPTYGVVDYGMTPAYGLSVRDEALTTSHSVMLTGLTPATTYHVKVTSSNSAGLSVTTADRVFTTRGIFEAVTVADIGNITIMEVSGSYDARKPDGSLNDLPRKVIAKEFLRQHPDEYDFLVVLSNFDFGMPQAEAKAFYLEVKNDTQGIGKTVFDNSAAFGSSGKLQGTIDMGNIVNLGINPLDPSIFENTLDTLAHEQLHRWAAGVKFKNADGTLNNALLGKDGTHWSYLLDTDGSLEYGNDWKANGDGTFTSVSASKYFSNLDLYLTGMIEKTQVPAMILIENASIDPTMLPSIGTTITGTVKTVTIDDIIAAEGERVPDASTSQKTFKTGFIFVTQPGTFTGTEPAAIETLRNAWAGRFKGLTGGKGSIADVIPSIIISLTSPADGATITKPFATIKGFVINSTGNETGVTVNGIPAVVMGNQFTAMHVPLSEGANTITVTATDTAGSTATSTVTVNAATTGSYIRISPNIASGVAPLEVTIRIDGTFSITDANFSAAGPVQPEITAVSVDEYKVKMIAEGNYIFTASSTGPDGITYQDTVTLTVQNRTQLDRLLKAKWEGMKTKLATQDVEGAVGYFNTSSQERYRQIFSALASSLPDIAQNMQDIQLIYLYNRIAKYRIRKNEIYGGQPTTITYYIYFLLNDKGRWSIDKF